MSAEDWLHSADPRRAAAAWHALMDGKSPSEAQRTALADWLLQSPAHVREYLELSAIREKLGEPAMFGDLSLAQLGKLVGTNIETLVIDAGVSRPRGTRTASGVSRFGRRNSRLALAAAVVVATFAGGWLYSRGNVPGNDSYATATGEQRSIVLADGSIAELNTRSTLQVRFSDATREVVLGEGEALFRVARDPDRPFRVRSGDTIIQAVGTAFTVRHDAERITVTVVEGRVSVQRAGPAVRVPARSARVELGAGERLAVDTERPAGRNDVRKVATAAALAWQERRLILDDLSLEQVVAEFNRYNSRQIHLDSGGLEAGSITGVFDANDPDSFISFLERRGDVNVNRDASGNMRIRAVAAAGAGR